MRYRNAVLGLILAALVIGCAVPGSPPASGAATGSEPVAQAPAPDTVVGPGSGPPAPAPGTPAPAPAPATPAPPTAAPASDGESPSASLICAPIEVDPTLDQRFRERERLVMDTLQSSLKGVLAAAVPDAVTRTARCLHAEPVVANLFVVSMPMAYVRELRVALWQREGAWQSGSLSPEPGASLSFRLVREMPAGIEALTVLRRDGTAHAGGYRLLRFASGMTVLWASKTYDQFHELILDDHWVLGTYRDPAVYNEPHVQEANCCYPSDGQVLWKWEGDALVEQASRIFPDPYRTVSAFVAAWDRGKPELLAPWVTDAAALKVMMADAGYPSAITMGPQLEAVNWLITLDAVYWDKLPPELRIPRPPVTELVWPSTPKPLRLKRVGDGWKVAGWGLLTGPGPSEMDAILPTSRLDPSAAEQGPYADLIATKTADAKSRLGEPARVIRTTEGTEILVYDRLGLALETWGGDVVHLIQTAGQVAPGIRIGGDRSVVEQLPALRVYETGRETIFTSHSYGTHYELHVASGRITRAYVYHSVATD